MGALKKLSGCFTVMLIPLFAGIGGVDIKSFIKPILLFKRSPYVKEIKFCIMEEMLFAVFCLNHLLCFRFGNGHTLGSGSEKR